MTHARTPRPHRRITLAAAAMAVLLVGASAPTAVAHDGHDAPTPGTACAMSGLSESVDGVMYLCQKGTGTPKWSKGLPQKRSPLTLADGWAKAVKTGMTAAFGVISNPTGKPIRVIGAASPLSAAVQLHEVVESNGDMVMQEKTGGFTIPAGGSMTLKPGGNHIMFMRVRKPISAGSLVPVTLITADGGQLTVKVLAKTYTGANEDYDPGMSGSG